MGGGSFAGAAPTRTAALALATTTVTLFMSLPPLALTMAHRAAASRAGRRPTAVGTPLRRRGLRRGRAEARDEADAERNARTLQTAARWTRTDRPGTPARAPSVGPLQGRR